MIISRSSFKLGHVRSKPRSLGQIFEKACVPSRGHSFDLKFMNYVRQLIIIISRSSSELGQVGSKIRLLGQILEKKFVYILEITVGIQSS